MRPLAISLSILLACCGPSGPGPASLPGVVTPGAPRATGLPSPAPAPVAGMRRSAGCARADAPGGVLTEHVMAAGRARTATVVAPMAVGPAWPVIFVLHGDGGSGAQIRGALRLEEQANGRALFVYPDGMVDLDTPAPASADVGLFDALLAKVAAGWCIDPGRVFVTGFSKGGYMANQLGCRRGDVIRAIASQSGGGPYENEGRYDEGGRLLCGQKPVASLIVHGLADGVVAPSEGQSSVQHWAAANGCAATLRSRGACVAHEGCANDVVSCTVPGLGHAIWREAAPTIWAFFDAQR